MQYFWEKSGWEKEDKHLGNVQKMPFQRPFPFIPDKGGFYVIRGPRQVGKSSWLKTILSHYAKKKKCFYLSCEEVADFHALGDILRSVRGYDVVLLDEISFVLEWDRAVKHAIDSGYPKMLVVTGSHAHDLKRGADRMPGRFDDGGEFTLLPMDFSEFTRARKQAGWWSNDLLKELKAYFNSGGFPTAVAEAGPNNKLPRKAMKTYWQWLAGDVVKLGKTESVLTEIVIQLARTMQSSLSFHTLAKKTTIGSHNTVMEYLSILESCFSLRTLYAIDIDTGAYRMRKERKFYFTDPILYHIGIDISGVRPPENANEVLAEMVANEHLARRFKRFGYHNNTHGEVDFVLPKEWAIEVKWVPALSSVSKTYTQLQVPDKIIWTQNNYLQEWPRS